MKLLKLLFVEHQHVRQKDAPISGFKTILKRSSNIKQIHETKPL